MTPQGSPGRLSSNTQHLTCRLGDNKIIKFEAVTATVSILALASLPIYKEARRYVHTDKDASIAYTTQELG